MISILQNFLNDTMYQGYKNPNVKNMPYMFLNCKSGICILRKTLYYTYLFKLPTWFLVWNTDTSKIFKEYSLFMSLNFRIFYLPVRWWLPC